MTRDKRMLEATTEKVLYLSPYFWPEEIGSAPYCRELAQFLTQKGYQVSALTFRPHYPNTEPFGDWADGSRDFETFQQIKIERVRVSPRGVGGFKDRITNDLRYLRACIRNAVLGTHKEAACIYTFIPSTLALYGAKALKLRSGAPIIAVVHDIESGLAHSLGITSNPLMFKLMRLVERIGLSFADRVVVLTEGMKQELLDLGCSSPIDVLPIWSQTADKVQIDAKAPVRVMYSGNFGKKQNLDQLLPLLTHISEASPSVEIVMRGNGSEKSRIEAEVHRRGVNNARFMDLAPADEFMTSLQSANVHLVPQALNVANYALPSKLFSIMSAGRPFVCFAEENSALDKLTKASNAGICVYPDNEQKMCEMVQSLLNDISKQRELGEAGRNYVQSNMNRDTILRIYESIMLDELKNKGASGPLGIKP
ncbi:glycosyltransferase family 4 protein [Ruegeria arenilitoris]|uniref:glycosyltransferase family 4 protein n=1 Tax=Ruegeria arenilitoris TaxID=1173585 RepID=UPI00147C1A12|nr:glycosyltransferase family 4 protein [Ruegeria arenilitoris]